MMLDTVLHMMLDTVLQMYREMSLSSMIYFLASSGVLLVSVRIGTNGESIYGADTTREGTTEA